MNIPVPPTRSSQVSFISSDIPAEPTVTVTRSMSNPVPPTSELSTEQSIFPTFISSLETASTVTSLSAEETTSALPRSSSEAVDPVTASDTTVQSLSTSVTETETDNSTGSGTIATTSDISTSAVESTAGATSDLSTTTSDASTSSEIETTSASEVITSSSDISTSDISLTTTEALTSSDSESTTTTTEEATTATELPLGACSSVLSAPTPIFSAGTFVDDLSAPVTFPFAISAFGSSGTAITVSTNGFLTVNSGQGASNFVNGALPDNGIAPISILPYWDDLAVSGDSQDRIEYEISGDGGERTITINWYLKTLSLLDQKSNQFTATFYENDPSIALFRYYKTTQGETSATVGGQNTDTGNSVQYEFNQDSSVADRSFVRLDLTGSGSFTTGTF
ncbi:hypothetical protein DER45DRAFT_640382 [Fusarium avenaceum]|nr:hypothetical protein DER45DRAFT_640382 [Fusarium avenaceum]